jgi:hypothetical protein
MKHTAGKWIDDGDDIGVEIDVAGDTVFLTICHIENPGLYTTTDSIAEEAANGYYSTPKTVGGGKRWRIGALTLLTTNSRGG